MNHKTLISLWTTILIVVFVMLPGQEKVVMNPSQAIDNAMLKSGELKSFQTISDETFLRRTYLSIAYRIPTLEEIQAFATERSPNKRSLLIEKLLNSVDYNEGMYPFWADMLRLQSKIKGVYGEKYEEWVKKSIAENKHYDKMVYELITASGRLSKNGAIGYYLRDEGNILETASTTSQIFLGTQIGCAQCHDHAFEDWTQKQFYEFASYMGKVNLNGNQSLRGIRKDIKDEDLTPQERNALRRIVEAISFDVVDGDKKELKYPNDYQYKNAKPNEIVKPHVFFGEQPEVQSQSQRREAFAKWLTAKENTYFTKIIVNRLWKRVTGKGLFEPLDDFGSDTKISHPEVLEILEKIMKDLDYDIKKFLSVLYNTQVYQIPSASKDISNSGYVASERPLLRMKAEQVWNSLLTLTRKDINEYYEKEKSNDFEELITTIQDGGLTESNKKLLLSKVKEMSSFRGKRPGNDKDKKIIEKDMPNEEKSKNELKLDSTSDAKMDSDVASMENQKNNNKLKGKLKDNLVGRASNISSPAPEQHILNFFGQSDRLIIEEGNLDPNLPQVLALLNSQLTNQFILKNSYIKRVVNTKKENIEKIEYLYQVILTRKPNANESKVAVNHISKNTKTGVEDIIWALVNTREFIFIQ